jgi:hypothetical protein
MRLRDGRVLERDEPLNRGSAERPLSDDDVAAKFRRNAGCTLRAAQVDALATAVDRIDSAPNVRQLTAALRLPT